MDKSYKLLLQVIELEQKAADLTAYNYLNNSVTGAEIFLLIRDVQRAEMLLQLLRSEENLIAVATSRMH